MQANFFGQFLINKGIISRSQFLMALQVQHANHVLLGQLAIEENILDALQVKDINRLQLSQNNCFGDIAVDMGLITPVQLNTLLKIQKTRNLRIGEILVNRNLLSPTNLTTQLQLHQRDCTDALLHLQTTVAQHPLKSILSNTIDICNSLFMRVLQSKCHVRNLIDSSRQDISFEHTSHILIHTQQNIRIALACSESCLLNIACAFIDMEPEDINIKLAEDVLGEFLNILLGQLLEDMHENYGDLDRSVPYSSKDTAKLIESANQFLVVHMTSQLGDFALLVLDDPA